MRLWKARAAELWKTVIQRYGKARPSTCLHSDATFPATTASTQPAAMMTVLSTHPWTGKELSEARKPMSRTDGHPYDFFAYYIDQDTADEDISRSKEDVRIMMDIDGHQDVMSSYATLTEEQLSRPGYTEFDKIELETYSFSSYSAKRNIHPVFYFKHHLTRIDFEMSAGSFESENIMIDSIVVQSKTKAIFTVAHKNPSNMGLDFSISRDYKGLALPEADGSKLRLDTWHPIMGEDGNPVRTKIGGCLLLAPDKKYQLSVHVKENKPDGSVLRYENRLSLSSPEGYFGEGNQYAVHLTVYGIAEIAINVELKKWQEGGNFTYDEEDQTHIIK